MGRIVLRTKPPRRRFRNRARVIAAAAPLLLGLAGSADAALTWGGNSSLGNTWDNSLANWFAGGAGTAWTAGGDAVFDATAEMFTIEIGGGVEANSLSFNADGYTISNGSITLGSGGILTGATFTATVNSALIGTLGLQKSGDGTLILGAANTYSGLTLIAAGTLRNAIDNAVTSGGNFSISAGGVWDLAGFSNSIGSLALDGASIVGGSGINQLTLGGDVKVVGGSTINNSLPINLGGAARSFDVASSLSVGTIAGAGGMTKTGAGTMTLNAAAQYTGATTINAGVLQLGATAALPTATDVLVDGATAMLDLGGASGQINGLKLDNGGGIRSFDQLTITNNLIIGDAGAATLNIGSTSSVGAAAVVVGNSTSAITLDGALATGSLVVAGGAINGTGSITLSGNIAGNAGAAIGSGITINLNAADRVIQAGSLTINGKITGAGGITIRGGELALSSGANDYTGETVIDAAVLRSLADQIVPFASLVRVTDGQWQVESFSNSVAGLWLDNGTIAGTGGIMLGGVLTSSGQSTINTTTLDLGGDRNIDVSAGILAINAVVSGAGGVTKSGGGTLIFNSPNEYPGQTLVAAGTLQSGADDAIPTGGAVNLDHGVWNLNSKRNSVGAATLATGTITGGGTITFGGDVFASGVSAIAIDAVILSAGAHTFTVTDSLTMTAPISGPGKLVKAGAATLTLAAVNSYADGTDVIGGVLVNASDDAVPATAGVSIISAQWDLATFANSIGSLSLSDASITGGRLTLGETLTSFSQSTISTATLDVGADRELEVTSGTLTINSVVVGAGGVLKTGAGVLVLGSQNTYSGSTTIENGTLLAGADNALPAGANVIVNSPGVWDLSTFRQDLGTLALVGGQIVGAGGISLGGNVSSQGDSQISVGTIDLGGITRDFAVDGTLAVSAVISGAGAGLGKSGAGILALNAVNTYGGATSITGGTLLSGVSGAVPSANGVSVGGGAWDLNGLATTVATLTLDSGTIVNGGAGGTLTLAANVTSSGSSQILGTPIDLGGADRTFDVTSGTLAIDGVIHGSFGITKTGGGKLRLIAANQYTGLTSITGGVLESGAANAIPSGGAVFIDHATWNVNGRDNTIGAATLASGTVASGSIITLGGNVASSGTSSFGSEVIDLNGADRTFDVTDILQLDAAIQGATAGIIKTGPGTLVMSHAASTYGGATQISAGTLQNGVDDALPDITHVDIAAGAAWDLNGKSDTISKLKLTSSQVLGGGMLSIGGDVVASDGSINTAGVILPAGEHLFSVTGTLTLNAPLSMPTASTLKLDSPGGKLVLNSTSSLARAGGRLPPTGILVDAGELHHGADQAAPAGTNFTINSPGTWNLHGFAQDVGSLTMGGAVISGGGTITLGGDVVATGTSQIVVDRVDLGGAGRTFSVTATGDELSVDATITGTGTVTKAGGGALLLNRANTWSGRTIISGGIVRNGVDNALPAGGHVTVDAAQWDLNGKTNPIGPLTVTAGGNVGAGTVVLGGNVSGGGTSTITASLDLGGSTRDLDVTGLLTVGAVIGNGGVNKSGGGTLHVTAPGTYTGATSINDGTLANGLDETVPHGGAVSVSAPGIWDLGATRNSASALILSDGSIAGAGTLALLGDVNSSGFSAIGAHIDLGAADRNFIVGAATLLLQSAISGGASAGIIKTGPGALALNTANSYPGATSVMEGLLFSGANGAVPATSALLVDSSQWQLAAGVTESPASVSLNFAFINGTDGTLALASDLVSAGMSFINLGTIDLNGAARQFVVEDQLKVTSHIVGSGDLIKSGAGTLILSATGAWSGKTRINSGTLVSSASGAVPATSAMLISNGTWRITPDVQESVASLNLSSGTVSIQVGTVELASDITSTGISALEGGTINLGSADRALFVTDTLTSSSRFTGTGGLFKHGTGTLVLMGNSNYVGPTTVVEGTLLSGTSSVIPNGSSVNILDGAVWNLDGNIETIATLSLGGTAPQGMVSGRVMGGGFLTLGGDVISTGNSTITVGRLDQGVANRTIQVLDSTLTIESVIVGIRDLVYEGPGVALITGAGGYTGQTTIRNAMVKNGVTNALPAGLIRVETEWNLNGFSNNADLVTLLDGKITGGGTLALFSNVVSAGSTDRISCDFVNVGATTKTFDVQDRLVVDATILGVGGVTKAGPGTLLLNSPSQNAGTTTINGGTLLSGIDEAVSTGRRVTIADARWEMAATNNTVGTLALIGLAAGSAIPDPGIHGTGTLGVIGDIVIDGASRIATNSLVLGGLHSKINVLEHQTGTIDSVIRGSVNVNKTGPGLLVLNAVNQYTGRTSVQGGTLTITDPAGLATSPAITVSTGATLNISAISVLNIATGHSIGGSGVVTGSVVIAPGGILALGASTTPLSVATLSLDSTLLNNQAAAGVVGRADAVNQLSLAGTSTLNLTGIPTAGTYDFLSFSSLIGGGDIVMGTAPAGFSYAISSDADSYFLTVGNLGLTWDVIPGNGTPDDGPGTWTIGSNFFDNATGTDEVGGWIDAGAPVVTFGSTIGGHAVAVGGDKTVTSLTFTQSYTLNPISLENIRIEGGISATASATINTGIQFASSDHAYDVGAGATLTLAHILSDNNALRSITKNGAGTLVIDASGHTGDTTVAAGTLTTATASALGSGAASQLNLAGGTLLATASFAGGQTISLSGTGNAIAVAAGATLGRSGPIVGSGGLTKLGGGTLQSSSLANNYTGDTVIDAGTLSIVDGGTLSPASAVVLHAGGALDLSNATANIFAAIPSTAAGSTINLGSGVTMAITDTTGGTLAAGVTGAGTLRFVPDAQATLTMTGVNSYTGQTSVNAGTLLFAAGGLPAPDSAILITPGGAIDFSNGTINTIAATPATLVNSTMNLGAGVTLQLTSAAAATLEGAIVGPGELHYDPAAPAVLSLSGPNTFAGGTRVGPAGTIRLRSPGGLGAGSVQFTNVDPAELLRVAFADGTLLNDIVLSAAGGIITHDAANQVATFSGAISGGSAGSTLALDGPVDDSSVSILTADNAGLNVGTVAIHHGQLAIPAPAALGNAAVIHLATTSDIAAGSLGGLRLDAGMTLPHRIVVGGGVINLPTSDGTLTGTIEGAGPLGKVGPGRLSITNDSNTHTGTIIVRGGELSVRAPGIAADSTNPLIVAAGATLSGDGTINRPISLAAGAVLSPGNSIGRLAAKEALFSSAILNFQFDLSSNDFLELAGRLTLTGTNVLNLSGDIAAGAYPLIGFTQLGGAGTVELADAPAGHGYRIDSDATSVILTVGQADYVWDASLTSSGPQDGGGDWTASTRFWDTFGQNNVLWFDSPGSPVAFGTPGGSGATVVISGERTVRSLRFLQNYVLQGTDEIRVAEGIDAVSSATINAPVAMLASQTFSVAAAEQLTIGVLGEATIGLSLTKTGDGGLSFSAAPAHTGGTTVAGGAITAPALTGGTLSIQTGARVNITAKPSPNSAAGTTIIPSLQIAGTPAVPTGTLDLANNSLVIDYLTVESLVDDTRQRLLAGITDGSGITTTSGTTSLRLGYADNAVLGRTTFSGVSVDSTSLLLMFTLAGDCNLDGAANISDFSLLASNFNQPGVWTSGDLDYNGTVAIGDFALLAANFNQTVGARPAAVPEPISLVSILSPILLTRRQRAR